MSTSVWRSLDEVPQPAPPSVVTVGNFDGVHRGHQAVLRAVAQIATARGLASVALTFDPHPKAVHDPAHQPELITGLADRLERIAATGVDGVLVEPYTMDFAMQTPQEFVRAYLVDGLSAQVVVVGKDTKFGRGNAGDVDTMRALGATMGFEVHVVDDAGLTSESGRRWSSSWLRELIDAGDMSGAADVLGALHRLRGTVEQGDKIGREIGFPTANVDVTDGMIPRHGVYAGWLTVVNPQEQARHVAGQPLPTAISIGVNYTVGGTGLRVEGYVIDSEGLDLYDSEVVLDLVQWRRPMLDFGSLDALTQALADDVAWCRQVLGLDSSAVDVAD